MISSERRELIRRYAREFEEQYLLQPDGQKHIAAYEEERREVRSSWEDIKEAKRSGKDITDVVLEKLLPYSNTRHNREKGYRISVAPGVTKDVRKWFEGAGWQDPASWVEIANAIFELVYRLVEDKDWSYLEQFEMKPESKGFKAGLLTPTFYFLNNHYRIINAKTIDTVNFIVGKKVIGRDLTNYRHYLRVIDALLDELSIPLFEDPDVFDAFCHWMCHKSLGGYARYDIPQDGTEEDILGRESFEETEPSSHWEAIYYIVKTGELLGYKTYVADPSRTAFGEKLGQLASLKNVPPLLKNASEISRVDAIWYKPQPPFFLFEVEDGGTMREALHRLYNAMAFDARFLVVSPSRNRRKFEKWVSTQPFSEFRERYLFRTYSELFEFYKSVKAFVSLRKRFLDIA